MTNKQTIRIDNQEYDAVTGLPVRVTAHSQPAIVAAPAMPEKRPSAPGKPAPSKVLHKSTQRSMTLNRKFTKRPAIHADIIPRHAPAKVIQSDVAPHAHVQKFAAHHVPQARISDIGPVAHPHVTKAHAQSAAKALAASQPTPQVPAATIKSRSLSHAVAKAAPTKKQHKTSNWGKRKQLVSVLSSTFALVLIAGYFTYVNMPNLSVRVAAAQAGIDASYPDYRPDGYSLNGPVTFDEGRVTIGFKANTNEAGFKINQAKSGWNSDAVLDNYVTPRAGSDYMPYSERGLTIYTFDNNAAWVNGGILYTIEGDAPLSTDQIRRIATSLL